MNNKCAAPFESIEAAQDYLALLAEVVQESQQVVDSEQGAVEQADRHLDALRLISYNLDKLSRHILRSRRILNDLRMLRRILRQGGPANPRSPYISTQMYTDDEVAGGA